MDIAELIDNIFNSKSKLYKNEIKNAYNKYVNTVSVDYMAASLECCVFLMVLYDAIKPKMVLDLGSGMSSYALRYFKKNHHEDSCVWSIDSDKEWLNKSKMFVEKFGLNIDNFKTWANINNDTTKFDLIFFDIDNNKKRINYIPTVLNNFVTKNSFIVFDDMHKGGLRRDINNVFSGYDHKKIDIKKYSFDKYKRFSSLYYNISKI
jgi:predicted O-methyltransferase YrrM